MEQPTGPGSRPAPFARVNVLGVPVSVCTVDAVARQVVEWAQAPLGPAGVRYVCATSVHGIMEAQRDPVFHRVLHDASIITPDGMPLAWMGRRQGYANMGRVYGPDVMLEVCRQSAPLGLRHFYYGGQAGVADLLAQRLQARFRGLVTAGTYCPPFREQSDLEVAEAADRINSAGTDILWVGMSTPKQERWTARARSLLAAKIALTVGAAFDFHTGRVVQAPKWMQSRGLEWLFRLTREPGRLWKRYLVNNPAFVWLSILQLAGVRRFDVLVSDDDPQRGA